MPALAPTIGRHGPPATEGPRPAAVRRVAIVLSELRAGGMERVVVHLAGNLAERGLEPRVVCLQHPGPLAGKLEACGVPLVALESLQGHDMLAIWRLARLWHRWKPDVINVHERASLPYAFLANRLSGRRPIVFSCHGLLFENTARAPWRERLAMRDVRAVTAVAEPTARAYAQVLAWTNPIHVVPNGVPEHPVLPHLRQAARQQLGLCNEDLVFLAVGNVKPEKGFEDLVEAAARLRGRLGIGRFTVLIAGGVSDKTYAASVESLAAPLRADGTVRLLGFRNDTEILYAAADAFVLSSRTEGLPMVLLEAMSAGLPVVATRVGGVPGVVVHESNGLLVPPAAPDELAEGMARLAADGVWRARLGAQAREDARRRYSVGAMTRQYLAVYQEAFSGQRMATSRSDGLGTRPKVLMLGPLPPATGGMATVLGNLQHSGLAARCRLHVLDNGKTTSEGRPLSEGILAQVRLLAQLGQTILRHDVQIVHIHTCSGFTFWRDCLHLAVAKMLRRKVVLHVHGGRFDEFGDRLSSPGRAALRLALHAADAVVALSASWVTRLRRYAPAARWRVVPNGVPIPPLRDLRSHPRVTFLFMGDLSQQKGAPDLVAAAGKAFRKGLQGTILIAGGDGLPGDRERMDRLVLEGGLASHIRLLGVVSGACKESALAEADCLVLPSYAEGLPMAILEGMAHGLPIIATRVGAIPEVITDGGEGFLVEPGDIEALADRLLRLSMDAELRQRMGSAGRLRVEAGHSLDVMVERLLKVYGEALKRQAQPWL